MERDHMEIHELAAGYALDALDPDERRMFEGHLAGCEQCRAELEAFEEAAAALALAVESPVPPPDLRQRLLVQALRERPNVVPLRRRFRISLSAGIAAVAACAALGLGIWAASLSGSLDRERDARRAQDRALAVIADPAAQRLPLSGARGTLIVAPNGSAALVVSGLPSARKGKTYEAWVIQSGTPKRAGLFSSGSKPFVLDGRVEKGAVVAVTLERSGGVDAPTHKPLFSAQVAQT